MEIIQKLIRVGYTRQQIAAGLPGKTGLPLVRLYERGDRFPGRKHFVCLVEMAEARGLTLLARDFIPDAVVCEDGAAQLPDANTPANPASGEHRTPHSDQNRHVRRGASS